MFIGIRKSLEDRGLLHAKREFQFPELSRLEAAGGVQAVAEGLELDGRHRLEDVQLAHQNLHDRTHTVQCRRRPRLIAGHEQPSCVVEFVQGGLEPQLVDLMHDDEQQFVVLGRVGERAVAATTAPGALRSAGSPSVLVVHSSGVSGPCAPEVAPNRGKAVSRDPEPAEAGEIDPRISGRHHLSKQRSLGRRHGDRYLHPRPRPGRSTSNPASFRMIPPASSRGLTERESARSDMPKGSAVPRARPVRPKSVAM